MISRDELWCELEKSLAALVGSLSARLAGDKRDLLEEFIENREYGLTLEFLCSYVDEQLLVLSPDQRAEVQRLAELMKIDL